MNYLTVLMAASAMALGDMGLAHQA